MRFEKIFSEDILTIDINEKSCESTSSFRCLWNLIVVETSSRRRTEQRFSSLICRRDLPSLLIIARIGQYYLRFRGELKKVTVTLRGQVQSEADGGLKLVIHKLPLILSHKRLYQEISRCLFIIISWVRFKRFGRFISGILQVAWAREEEKTIFGVGVSLTARRF